MAAAGGVVLRIQKQAQDVPVPSVDQLVRGLAGGGHVVHNHRAHLAGQFGNLLVDERHGNALVQQPGQVGAVLVQRHVDHAVHALLQEEIHGLHFALQALFHITGGNAAQGGAQAAAAQLILHLVDDFHHEAVVQRGQHQAHIAGAAGLEVAGGFVDLVVQGADGFLDGCLVGGLHMAAVEILGDGRQSQPGALGNVLDGRSHASQPPMFA